MAREFVRATYRIETAFPLDRAAAALAGEQSSGTFVRVHGETDELRDRHLAKVERLTPLDESPTPSLPGAAVPKGVTNPVYRRAELVVAFPLENMGTNLPTVLATVAGNLFELREFSGLKLLDLDFPEAFRVHPGPQFGVAGTRRLTGVASGPMVGTIVKPSVGLTPGQTADLVRTLAEAGIDFVKDDELQADSPHSPLEDRVKAVMRVVNAHADRTGKKVMVAFNISDDVDAMRRHHDTVLAHGGTCVMVSLNHVGLAGVMKLRQSSELPIHGHRNGWGMLTRSPALGVEFAAYQKVWRLAGVDHLHVNGLRNKFWEPDESVVRSIKACLSPLLGGYGTMPVVASGQTVRQPPDTYRLTGSADLMYLAGGGMMAHSGGPAAGCRAIRQAWDAAVAGVPLDEHAKGHPELRAALEAYRE
ncbi:MAG: ribulose 1,5-bisphosphate carboxylase [Isosphaera sp.]|nr:ribulose 1,5-bisphosphate carboxylase [Isosphaera sp.]